MLTIGPPVVTVTSVQYTDPPPVVVTETTTSYYVEQTALPPLPPTERGPVDSSPPQNLVVWVVVGVVGVIMLVASVAFVLRRMGRRSRDPEYPPALSQMASVATSPSKSITPNRSH